MFNFCRRRRRPHTATSAADAAAVTFLYLYTYNTYCMYPPHPYTTAVIDPLAWRRSEFDYVTRLTPRPSPPPPSVPTRKPIGRAAGHGYERPAEGSANTPYPRFSRYANRTRSTTTRPVIFRCHYGYWAAEINRLPQGGGVFDFRNRIYSRLKTHHSTASPLAHLSPTSSHAYRRSRSSTWARYRFTATRSVAPRSCISRPTRISSVQTTTA